MQNRGLRARRTSRSAAKGLFPRTGAGRSSHAKLAPTRARTNRSVDAEAPTLAPVGAGGRGRPRRLVLAAPREHSKHHLRLRDRAELASRLTTQMPELPGIGGVCPADDGALQLAIRRARVSVRNAPALLLAEGSSPRLTSLLRLFGRRVSGRSIRPTEASVAGECGNVAVPGRCSFGAGFLPSCSRLGLVNRHCAPVSQAGTSLLSHPVPSVQVADLRSR